MAKCLIEFSPNIINKSISDFTWDFCMKISNVDPVSTLDSTLYELGNGCYILTNDNITEDTVFRLHLTSDTNVYSSGTFSLSDGNLAQQSSVLGIPVNPLLASNYIPPDNSSIGMIKSKTDQLEFVNGKVNSNPTININALGISTSQQVIDSTNTILGKLGVLSNGNILIDENYPSTDNLRYLNNSGTGIDNASIVVFLKEDFNLGNKSSSFIKGSSTTKMDGRWSNPIYLDPNLTFVVQFFKQGEYQPTSIEITT